MANLFIVVLQPEDETVRTAAGRLSQKPSAHFPNKILCTMDTVPSDVEADKVYLVGHGGANTLGGTVPDILAMRVLAKPSLRSATKIVLAMCGDENMLAAKAFADVMRTGVPLLGMASYRGEIVAYSAPLLITTPLDGVAEQHVGRKMAEVQGKPWTARQYKEFL